MPGCEDGGDCIQESESNPCPVATQEREPQSYGHMELDSTNSLG